MTVETPQPRDRVRWQRTSVIEGVVEEITSDGIVVRDSDGYKHLCQVDDVTVEVLEKAADDDAPKLRPGTYELTKRVHVGEDGLARFVDMPDGPLAEYVEGFWHKTRTWVRKIEPARPSVRVPNEPHGPSPEVRERVAELVRVGNIPEAVKAVKAATHWLLDDAHQYVREMAADRMRAMGFDKQPEVQISDEDRALIASVLEERMGEYFRDTGYGYRLNTDHLDGVVADIVYAAIVQDRKRGDR